MGSGLPYSIAGPAGSSFAEDGPSSCDETSAIQSVKRRKIEEGEVQRVGCPVTRKVFEAVVPSGVRAPSPRLRHIVAKPFQRQFHVTAWHEMLRYYGHHPYGTTKISESIALVKRRASQNKNALSSLPILVQTMSFLGDSAYVEPVDLTGSIPITFLKTAYDEYRAELSEGSVIYFDAVRAVLYAERKASGYAVDVNEGFHVTVAAACIRKIFPKGEGESVINRGDNYCAYESSASEPFTPTREVLQAQRNGIVLHECGEEE